MREFARGYAPLGGDRRQGKALVMAVIKPLLECFPTTALSSASKASGFRSVGARNSEVSSRRNYLPTLLVTGGHLPMLTPLGMLLVGIVDEPLLSPSPMYVKVRFSCKKFVTCTVKRIPWNPILFSP